MKSLCFTLVLVLASAAAGGAEVRKEDRRSVSTSDLSRVDVELPVGEFSITTGNKEVAVVEMKVHCSWKRQCERADRIELDVEPMGGSLLVRLENFPESVRSLSVDLKITVPSRFGLILEQGVGDAEIRGLLGDIEVDLGVGDVDLESEASAFRSVSAEVGVGDADLRVGRTRPGEREGFLFLGNTVEWREGTGRSRIDVEVGVGDAEVNLK